MEDIDGGLHPAVDGQSLDDDAFETFSSSPRAFKGRNTEKALNGRNASATFSSSRESTQGT